MHCSNCHAIDHNIRKCRHAPALNGWQQRARDWESSPSCGISSSGSSNEELNSDKLQDLQFQAEMEQYDAIMEKAHVIVEKERQRQEKKRNLESDSELSLGQSGDVEMGGTSASLTDQDVQDGRGDGLGDVSGRVGGSIAILGAGTSPRRTRSGKIVKYVKY